MFDKHGKIMNIATFYSLKNHYMYSFFAARSSEEKYSLSHLLPDHLHRDDVIVVHVHGQARGLSLWLRSVPAGRLRQPESPPCQLSSSSQWHVRTLHTFSLQAPQPRNQIETKSTKIAVNSFRDHIVINWNSQKCRWITHWERYCQTYLTCPCGRVKKGVFFG